MLGMQTKPALYCILLLRLSFSSQVNGRVIDELYVAYFRSEMHVLYQHVHALSRRSEFRLARSLKHSIDSLSVVSEIFY